MSFWRKEDPEFNDNGGIVKGGMWYHQRKWWNSPHFIKALVTGYSGGKTFISAKRAIALAIFNCGSPHLYVSPSYKLAKRTIIVAIDELLDARRIKHKYNKTDHEYILTYKGNKGKIWIGSGDDAKSLKGPNVGSANIDEPFIQDKEVFKQVIARVRDSKARHREIGLTGTPEELNWGYEVCTGESEETYDLDLIQASSRDNKANPDSYIKTLEGAYDKKTAQAYIDGQFLSLNAGATYYNYDSKLNNTGKEIDEDRTIMVGMDFNVDPMSCTLSHDIAGCIYACDEIFINNSNTEALCKAILERYPKGRFIVYPDSTGKNRRSNGFTDFAIIKEVLGKQLESLQYPKKNPYLRDRFNAVNTMMLGFDGIRRAFINKKNCPELVKDLQQVTFPYDEYKRKNPKRTHYSDNWGYNICREYSVGKKPSIKVT